MEASTSATHFCAPFQPRVIQILSEAAPLHLPQGWPRSHYHALNREVETPLRRLNLASQ